MSEAYTSTMLLSTVRESLRDIGYQDGLLKKDYNFVDVFSNNDELRQIDLAAFAQEPPSYRNACFGFIISQQATPEAVMKYMALGAPQIFSLHPITHKVHRWKLQAKDQPVLLESIELDDLQKTIVAHKTEWNPEQVLRAKSIGFVKGFTQLDFFDIGLIPSLESFVYEKLDKLLRDTITSSEIAFKEHSNEEIDDKTYKSLFRLIFRLIAAKLLGDRQHPGNWLSSNAQEVIKEVETFYTISSGDVLKNTTVQDVAWRKIRNAFSFQNLSVEALAYVYENTFVSDETRKVYGTHATVHNIAEYIIQSLPIEEIDPNNRYIFEPFAGHGPFLVAALQRLKSLLPANISMEYRHNYFVKMLAGMELDAFACEVARYSLILADYPNPNGWLVENDNFFSSHKLKNYLERARIVLCNPPYEDFTLEDREKGYSQYSINRAAEALQRILSFKPEMIGFVLPRTFIDGRMYANARKQIANLYDNTSLTVLPDNAFNYSESETVLIIAHGQRVARPIWSSSFVKKTDFENFIYTGAPTWQIKASDSYVEKETHSPNPNLWYTPMQPIWDALAHLPHLSELVEIHIGIQHNIPFKANEKILVSQEPKDGFVEGLIRVTDDFEPYIAPPYGYINLDPSLIMKSDKWPWDQPKVLTNAVRLSRGPWTISASIDKRGLACMQNFHGIWPRNNYPLEVIAALINGPIANAFLSSHNTTKHNKLGTTLQIPVPNLKPAQIRLIVSLVNEYTDYRHHWQRQPERSKFFERRCKGIMRQIDGEILAAYDLAPHLEQQLLQYFSGFPKPGPIEQTQLKSSPTKRMYTSLIKVENVKEDNNSKLIEAVEAVIINWDPNQKVSLPIDLIPDNVKEKLNKDVWLLAHVSVGATKATDLWFENFELAPEPRNK